MNSFDAFPVSPSEGPILLTWFNFNPHMPTKMWDAITYPFANFETFNGCTVEDWE